MDAPALKLAMEGKFDNAKKAYDEAHPAPAAKNSNLSPDMQNALDVYKNGKVPQVAELTEPGIQSVPRNLPVAERGNTKAWDAPAAKSR